MNRSMRVRLNSRFLLKTGIACLMVVAVCATASAQTGSAVFDGTWAAPTTSESGTVHIVFTVDRNFRSFAADFGGTLLGATNPSLRLSDTLDANGGVTMRKTGDPVFGDVTLMVASDGRITGTFRGIPDKTTRSMDVVGLFADRSLQATQNSLTMTFTQTVEPRNTATLRATQVTPVPTMPEIMIIVLFVSLLLAGVVMMRRQVRASYPA
jgi:hypothetical protein